VGSGVETVVRFVSSLPGRIWNFFKDAGTWLLDAGANIIEGLINGITNTADRLKNFIIKFIKDHVPGPILSFFGISSPSKLMMGYGANVGEGFALGIASTAPLVASATAKLSSAALGNFDPESAGALAGSAASGGSSRPNVNVTHGDMYFHGTSEEMLAQVDAKLDQRDKSFFEVLEQNK
jgi:hypothetical protein